jgi:ribosomal protein L28
MRIPFLYTNNKHAKNKTRKIFPFTIVSKIKYLGINLTKKLKTSTMKSITHKKEIEDTRR